MPTRRIAASLVVAVVATALQAVMPAPAQAAAGTPILGPSAASENEARTWAAANAAPSWYVDLAPRFWAIAASRGVRPDVAYAQSAKETGFGRFGGVVDPSFRNPCGIKTTAGGANSDPNAHARFPNWDTGITACVDHLALYAGAPGYPRADSPDPRHFGFILGTAPTVEQLGGRWAPSADYGTSIVNGYLIPMIVSNRCGFLDTPRWAAESICWMADNSYATGYPDATFRPNWAVTRAQVANMLWAMAGRPDPGEGCGGFTDVPRWARDGICWLLNAGYATGYPDRTFRPNSGITRGELANLVWGMAGRPDPGDGCLGFTDVPRWARDGICWLLNAGYATGYPDGTFRPNSGITRAQVANILWGIYA